MSTNRFNWDYQPTSGKVRITDNVTEETFTIKYMDYPEEIQAHMLAQGAARVFADRSTGGHR